MICNWNLTLMYLLILYCHLQNTQNQTTYIFFFNLHLIFLYLYMYLYVLFYHGFTNSAYAYKQSVTGSTAQYNDKGDKFFVTFN